jgi:hypothetical protein
MPFNRGFASVMTALNEGRVHTQRFVKNAGPSHGSAWTDPTFSSGQPAYDARVGVLNTFTPMVAQRNDAIWFPGINAGQTRHLLGCTMRPLQSTWRSIVSVVLFDLLGYYPMVDGDSTDPQVMDNTLTLPRYQDGDNVRIAIVNHIAPALQNGVALIDYTDEQDQAHQVQVTIPNLGQNLVVSGQSPTSVNQASVFTSLNGGRGVKRIDAITYTTPPGGLHCYYLCKTLGTVVCGNDNGLALEKCFACHNGFNFPRIHDGAWISWFHRLNGTASTVTWWGDFTFFWE